MGSFCSTYYIGRITAEIEHALERVTHRGDHQVGGKSSPDDDFSIFTRSKREFEGIQAQSSI
jgi:hypothetical protein